MAVETTKQQWLLVASTTMYQAKATHTGITAQKHKNQPDGCYHCYTQATYVLTPKHKKCLHLSTSAV